MKSSGASSSNEMQRLDWNIGYLDSSPSNGRQGDLPYLIFMMTCRENGDSSHDTVGAVALDGTGNTAAASSTGGINAKLPGRVGDSAIIGQLWNHWCLWLIW